jgi:DNA-binding NarL/FixJ family response regulator
LTVIDVMLVAPVRAYRDALSALIDSDDELRVVAHADSSAEALARLAPGIPGVALLDFGMEPLLPILEALRRMAPSTQMLAFAVPVNGSQSEIIVRAAETGVTGFIDADQPLSEVVHAIHLAVRGQSPCSPRIAATLLGALRRRPGTGRPSALPGELAEVRTDVGAEPALTPRELLVAQLVAHGMTNRQIAGELVVGVATVKTHVHSVLRKLGVGRREQIALADIIDGGRPRG